MKMDGFLMCQEMFHASFSTEALLKEGSVIILLISVKKTIKEELELHVA